MSNSNFVIMRATLKPSLFRALSYDTAIRCASSKSTPVKTPTRARKPKGSKRNLQIARDAKPVEAPDWDRSFPPSTPLRSPSAAEAPWTTTSKWTLEHHDQFIRAQAQSVLPPNVPPVSSWEEQLEIAANEYERDSGDVFQDLSDVDPLDHLPADMDYIAMDEAAAEHVDELPDVDNIDYQYAAFPDRFSPTLQAQQTVLPNIKPDSPLVSRPLLTPTQTQGFSMQEDLYSLHDPRLRAFSQTGKDLLWQVSRKRPELEACVDKLSSEATEAMRAYRTRNLELIEIEYELVQKKTRKRILSTGPVSVDGLFLVDMRRKARMSKKDASGIKKSIFASSSTGDRKILDAAVVEFEFPPPYPVPKHKFRSVVFVRQPSIDFIESPSDVVPRS